MYMHKIDNVDLEIFVLQNCVLIFCVHGLGYLRKCLDGTKSILCNSETKHCRPNGTDHILQLI